VCLFSTAGGESHNGGTGIRTYYLLPNSIDATMDVLNLGRDCLTESYGGFGVFCRGDRRGFDGFRRMATECLAGWKLDESRGVAGKGNDGIEFLRTATTAGREVATHVQGCKVLLDDDASAGENLVISIFTTERTPDAGAP